MPVSENSDPATGGNRCPEGENNDEGDDDNPANDDIILSANGLESAAQLLIPVPPVAKFDVPTGVLRANQESTFPLIAQVVLAIHGKSTGTNIQARLSLILSRDLENTQ